MDEKKARERIKLRGNQQTTIAVGFARGGKSKIEPGDTIAVASSAATILNARYNPETGLIDVVPIQGALGDSEVTVGITLADGSVLPPQVVEYRVVHPDAEAVVLAPGSIGDKKTIITNPVPNAEPHVVPAPPEPRKVTQAGHQVPGAGAKPAAPAASGDIVNPAVAKPEPGKTTGTFQVDQR